MRSRKAHFAFVAFAIGTLLTVSVAFVACGDDDSSEDERGTGTAASSSTSGAPTSAGDKTNGTTAASPGSGQVTGSGANAFKALAKDLDGKTYRVSYEMTQVSAEGTMKGVLTLAHKPPKEAFAFEITESADGTQFISFIDDGTNTLSCFGDSKTSGTCMKGKSDSSSPLGSLYTAGAILDELTSSIDVTETDSQTIAGADSRCFKVKDQDGSLSVTCFSKKDGLLTSIQSDDQANGEKTTIKATSISTKVDDSAFAAPKGYTVEDTGG